MILNPWVIGMYVTLLGMTILYAYALRISYQIVRNWDITSMEEGQLVLERKSHLAATIIQYGLWVQVLSILLFYMTLESVAEVIPGAMCATGAIKANPYGFPALFVKMAVAFVCAVWFTIHYVDARLEDYRLTPMKFKCLFILAPLLLGDLALQFLYFVNLDPNVITSCCGVVFEIEGEGFGSSVASLPPYPMIGAFYVAMPLLLSVGYVLSRKRNPIGYYVYTLFGVFLFVLSILAVLSFMTPYIYEAPTLHCPFCVMRTEYNHIGYLLYTLLFAASFLSLVPGIIEFLKRRGEQIRDVVGDMQKRAVMVSMILWTLFVLIPSVTIFLYEVRAEGAHLFN